MRAKFFFLHIFLVLLALLLTAFPTAAQERAVGVTVHTEDAYDGYTLFSPLFNRDVFLIDNNGRVIHKWLIEETAGVADAHLLDNGHLIIVAGPRNDIDESLFLSPYASHGSIREYTWDNELVWEIEFIDAETHQHHAIDIMPNGNILAILWVYYPLDDALAMGLDPRLIDIGLQNNPYLLPDRIIEIDRSTGEFVWQWDAWDHLVQDHSPNLPNYGAVAEHPQRLDINYHFWSSRGIGGRGNGSHWMHSNSVHYNPGLDQVVLSVRNFDEFWIIDHGAPGKRPADSAGGLLYRWGNPYAYQQGDQRADRQLFRQHDVQWIESGLPGEGNILLFNNRHNQGTDEEKYSSVMELKLPLRADGSYDWDQEAEIVWSYAADGFYSGALSGAQRLPNGNTLITEGVPGRLIEVTAAGETVWEFVSDDTSDADPSPSSPHIFRVHKYPPDYPGFDGKDMTPGDLFSGY